MPVELVERGRTVARETIKCPCCSKTIIVKYDVKTKEVLFVFGAYDPDKKGIIQCHNCYAKLKWTPPREVESGRTSDIHNQ